MKKKKTKWTYTLQHSLFSLKNDSSGAKPQSITSSFYKFVSTEITIVYPVIIRLMVNRWFVDLLYMYVASM